MKRWIRAVAWTAVGVALLAGLLVALGPSMGLFSGKRPAELGFALGAFKAGDWRPNWVSSTAPRDDAKHRVEAFAIDGDHARAWAALEALIATLPRARAVTRAPGYLHVEFASAVMGFVDDAEFALDASAGAIHVKSAARLGVRDFGVNRARVESIRKALSERLRSSARPS